MQQERKYKVITLMTGLLTLLLLGNCIREPFRMKAAEAQQREEYVLKGARIYAEQCVQCHGPRGEGSVGMPLNRTALKIDDRTPAGRAVYDMLYQAVNQGRKGNENHVQWERTPDGRWISYTAMAAWGKEYGGPLDEEALRAVTLFIMNPGGEQWSLIGDIDLAPTATADYTPDETGRVPLPDARDVDPAINARAKELLQNRTKTQCLNCHFIGTRGAKVGPDLTQVGKWGLDREFLEQFLAFANQPLPDETERFVVPHDKRMPVYWSANRAVTGPSLSLDQPVTSEGPYYMLRFHHKLSKEEISVLATYLLGLK